MSLARTNPELLEEQRDTQEDIQYMEQDASEKLPDAHYNLCNGCAECEPDR